MSCGAAAGACSSASCAPAIATPCFVTSGPVPTGGSSSRPLTAGEKEAIKRKRAERAEKKAKRAEKKAKRAEKNRQRKQACDETKADIKSKAHETTGKKAKLHLYATLLKLRLHL
jgi:hypothetical protein